MRRFCVVAFSNGCLSHRTLENSLHVSCFSFKHLFVANKTDKRTSNFREHWRTDVPDAQKAAAPNKRWTIAQSRKTEKTEQDEMYLFNLTRLVFLLTQSMHAIQRLFNKVLYFFPYRLTLKKINCLASRTQELAKASHSFFTLYNFIQVTHTSTQTTVISPC